MHREAYCRESRTSASGKVGCLYYRLADKPEVKMLRKVALTGIEANK
jgi:hypothetical protein